MSNDLFEKTPNKSDQLPIVEEFYSIQGEGYHAGKPAYFIRIGGCDIACHYCDTKISWNSNTHKSVTIDEITKKILATPARSVVVTGGEPTLYNLQNLTTAIQKNKIQSFLETSGAYQITGNWNWICVSPKQQKKPLIQNLFLANELKIVVANESDLLWAEECRTHVNPTCKLYLQPEFSNFETATALIVEYAKTNPAWNISVQIHKFMNIP